MKGGEHKNGLFVLQVSICFTTVFYKIYSTSNKSHVQVKLHIKWNSLEEVCNNHLSKKFGGEMVMTWTIVVDGEAVGSM
jgi:hypothetical protein